MRFRLRVLLLVLLFAALSPGMDDQLLAWSVGVDRAAVEYLDQWVLHPGEAVRPTRDRMFDDATKAPREGVTQIVERAMPALQQVIDGGKLVGEDLSRAQRWRHEYLVEELAGCGLLSSEQQRKLVRRIQDLEFEQVRDRALVERLETKVADDDAAVAKDQEAMQAAKTEIASLKEAARKQDRDVAAMREDIATLVNTLEQTRQKLIEKEPPPVPAPSR
jgi:hypothetical protein